MREGDFTVLIKLCKEMELSVEDTKVILHAVARDENFATEAKELIELFDRISGLSTEEEKDSKSKVLLKKLQEMLKNIRFKQIQDKFREIREQEIKEKNSDGGR